MHFDYLTFCTQDQIKLLFLRPICQQMNVAGRYYFILYFIAEINDATGSFFYFN